MNGNLSVGLVVEIGCEIGWNLCFLYGGERGDEIKSLRGGERGDTYFRQYRQISMTSNLLGHSQATIADSIVQKADNWG